MSNFKEFFLEGRVDLHFEYLIIFHYLNKEDCLLIAEREQRENLESEI